MREVELVSQETQESLEKLETQKALSDAEAALTRAEECLDATSKAAEASETGAVASARHAGVGSVNRATLSAVGEDTEEKGAEKKEDREGEDGRTSAAMEVINQVWNKGEEVKVEGPGGCSFFFVKHYIFWSSTAKVTSLMEPGVVLIV